MAREGGGGGLKLQAHVGMSTGGNEWIARVVLCVTGCIYAEAAAAVEVCVSLCRTDRGTHHVTRRTRSRPPFEREHLRPRRANLDGSAYFSH